MSLPSLRSTLNSISFSLVSGVKEISDTLAMVAFLFAGSLSAGYHLAAILFLCSAIVIRLTVAVFSRLPNAVGGPQEIGLSVIFGVIAALPAAGGQTEAHVATAIAVCGMTSLLTGLLFVVIGHVRLAHFARLLPYPVLAGFLAGSGWLLLSGGITMVTGALPPVDFSHLHEIKSWLEGEGRLGILISACILALTILIGNRWSQMTLAAIAGAVILFYGTVWILGLPLENVRSLGWLPMAAAETGNGSLSLNVGLIDWQVLLAATPLMLTAAGLSAVSQLLSTSGLALRSRSDVDANHELRSQGMANIVIGAFGGIAGYVTVGSTVLANRLGVPRLTAGVMSSVVILFGIALSGPIISYMPVFLTSGLIIYSGLDLLFEWAYTSRRRLPLFDWLLILLILGIIIFTGIMNGIIAGIALSVAMFVYNYAKIPVIRVYGSVKDMRSNVDRAPEANVLLGSHGESADVYILQGYLFFATAKVIVDEVRERCEKPNQHPLLFVVMDFTNVSGCDSAAVSTFASVINLASKYGFVLVFAGMSAPIRRLLDLSQSVFIYASQIKEFPDLDHAIEYCEERILHEYQDDALASPKDALSYLKAHLGEQSGLEAAASMFEMRHMKEGDYLIRRGEAADDVFIILSGRVRVQVELPNGRILRLRTMTLGAIVGDIAFYTKQRRTADVIIDRDSTVLRLSAAGLKQIEETDGILASSIHRMLARTLAEKLVLANNVIRLLHR